MLPRKTLYDDVYFSITEKIFRVLVRGAYYPFNADFARNYLVDLNIANDELEKIVKI
jgi:hypothetical protein